MNNIILSIKELCERFITPAIEKSGWNRKLQISFYEDTLFVYKKLDIEYVLFYKPNIPVAVISVTENNTKIDLGIEQAIKNAETLDVPCAFSSNGSGFLFYDRTKPAEYAQTKLDLKHFLTPEQLWAIYLNYKNTRIATDETVRAFKNGQNRLFLSVATVGVGFVTMIFQIIKGLFETRADKHALYLTDRDDYWRSKDWDYWRNKSNWENQTSEFSPNQPQNNNNPNYIAPLSLISTNNSAGIYWASTKDLSAQSYKQLSSDFFDVIVVDKNHSGNIINLKESQEPLEYFKGATQIAITSQEKVSESDVDYFGMPILIDASKESLGSNFPTYNLSTKETPISHTTNNLQIENNTYISANNSTTVNNSMTNDYTDKGDIIINNTENNYTQINYNKIIINSTVMARQTSFSHQVELAEELKKYLHGFQERLGDVAQNYKNKCNDLFEAGMMDETFRDFEQNYMQETIRKIANVVEQINERDIPFMEKYIDYLEQNPSR